MPVLLFLRDLIAETRRSERGASAVEYGLLVAGIAAVIVAAVFLFGGALNVLMGDSCGTITSFVTGNGDC
ncbi:Flp family type IVb pilin [Nocardioides sp. Y6]|uniref:Flp family type IVb pilin n=1 Tax=Nocardioides malaquae TaxID=2773426 RepID=A0ABR9RPY5_9ACTN|nr:Flp family type IVb pilin [Nocardioides malaquae]MBE7323282.1 Flp family type IVb pilin [Nocardioides malaquae]